MRDRVMVGSAGERDARPPMASRRFHWKNEAAPPSIGEKNVMTRRLNEWILLHPVKWGVAGFAVFSAVKIAIDWGHTTHAKREARWVAYQSANRATRGFLRKLLG